MGGYGSKDDPRMEQVKKDLIRLQFQMDPAKKPVGATDAQLFSQPLPMEVPRL